MSARQALQFNTKTTKDTKTTKGSCQPRPRSFSGLFVVLVVLVFGSAR